MTPFEGNVAHKLDTVGAREKLQPRRDPYWLRITKGCYLGFRKMTVGTSGTWQARCRRPDGELAQTTLGTLEEHRAHERFDKAVAAARAWFDANLHPIAKPAGPTSVREACCDYVDHVREQKRRRSSPGIGGPLQTLGVGRPNTQGRTIATYP